MTDSIVGWSQAQIDTALTSVKRHRDNARAAGRLAGAEQHDAWINRLLDARPFHPA